MFVKPALKIDTIDVGFGDKSVTHRAFICGALSDGCCTVYNAGLNADTLATADCLTALGASFEFLVGKTIIRPIKNATNDVVLDCKNSATTARLLAGVVAGLNVEATFIGDQSLSRRPMQNVAELLNAMGANIVFEQGCLFKIKKNNGLRGKEFNLKKPSAQVKSALLFAGLFAQGATTVIENITTRNHTEIMLSLFGADVQTCGGKVTIKPSALKSIDITVANDFSTAANLVALGIAKGGITLKNVLLNPTRTEFLTVLSDSGADISVSDAKIVCGENVGDLTIRKSVLKPFNVSQGQSALMLDEIPVLCLIAALAKGTSRFEGLGGLKVKETDRIATTVAALKSIGVSAECDEDSITVHGNEKILGGNIPTTDDHRISMLGVVAGLLSQNGCEVSDASCIAVSCPCFFALCGMGYKLCLVGSDVKNSLSPQIYALLGKNTGIKVSYDLLQTEKSEFETTLKRISKEYYGANLTMPFKNQVKPDKTVNTLLFAGKTLCFNTDGYGVMTTLKQAGIDVKNAKLLVVGCGGAAQAAIKCLVDGGARVTVKNRTAEKAEQLKKVFDLYDDDDFDGILSFVPVKDKLCFVTEKQIAAAKFVFDAYYFCETELLKTAKRCGVTALDGKKMLFWQAVKNFEIWTNKTLSLDIAQKTYKEFEGL